MQQFIIAVLSDLHVGNSARSKDLCPHSKDKDIIDYDYQEKFLKFISKEKISADYLILPGDMTDSAQLEEVKIASDFISSVIKKFKVPLKKILFVPGNHEVDWEVLKLDKNALRWKQRYDALKDQSYIFNKILKFGKGCLINEPYITYRELDDIILLGYNSSWNDDYNTALHFGLIDPLHIESMRELLSKTDYSPEKLKIFLVHHHPIAYRNPVPLKPDFSQMQNSEDLLNLLLEYKFDLLIHGHTHQPRFKVYTIDGTFPVAILSAGSFSVDLPKEWEGGISNQFHLIQISGRDKKTNHVYGKIKSWSYYISKGWIKSEVDRGGILHEEPFGYYLTNNQLLDELERILNYLFSKCNYIEYDSVTKAGQLFDFIRPDQIIQGLKTLEPKVGFKLHGNSVKDYILLKEIAE